MVHELTQADARRIAVLAQLLGEPRPTDLLDVVRHLTFLEDQPELEVLFPCARAPDAYSPVRPSMHSRSRSR